MRCLALAQAWRRRGGAVSFVSRCDSDRLRLRVEAAGVVVRGLPAAQPAEKDLEDTLGALAEWDQAWLVLDGYRLDVGYQRQAREAGHRILVIDDFGSLEHYYADLVINQNGPRDGLRYAREPYTVLLLGPQYALLREEFLARAPAGRVIAPTGTRVLVSLGGADPENQTEKVVRALRRLTGSDVEAVVVVGPSNSHAARVREAARGDLRTRVVENVEDMAALMAWADLAVAGGGTTVWELAFMGLPAILLVLAENQRAVAAASDEAGTSVNLGWFERVGEAEVAEAVGALLHNPDRRRGMSERGRGMVDGRGSERVLDKVRELTPCTRSGSAIG